MRLFIAAAVAITLPAIYMRWYHIQLDPRLDSMIFGVGILGAAFLLSWGAEVAQMDISRGLALAILALIAILPEYAVDSTSPGLPPMIPSTFITLPPT